MQIAILCLLLAPLILGASIPDTPILAATSIEPATSIPDAQSLRRSKRFLDWFDDDDYFDDFPLRRRRPSRRTIQLAQMIRQLAGPQGLNQAQLQNMLQNLQNLQLMNNMQQLMQLQNLQAQPSTTNPISG